MASKYPLLDSGYGVLNPTFDTLTKKNFDTEQGSFLSLVRATVKNNYGVTETFGTGPMLGIVLRVEGKTNLQGSIDPTSYTSTTERVVEQNIAADGEGLWQVKVRIPEFHASLPIPDDLPEITKQSPDHDIINMYPTFTAETSDIKQPIVGSKVWVDFQNKESMSGGIYLGMVDSSKIAPANMQPKSGKEAFNQNRKERLSNPTGQEATVDSNDLVPLSLRGNGYEFKFSARDKQANYLQNNVAPAMSYIAKSYAQKISTLSPTETPYYPFLILGDASGPKGGDLQPHVSHKVGEDIDIGTPWKKVENEKGETRNRKDFQNFKINAENVSVEGYKILIETIFEAPDNVLGTPKIKRIIMAPEYKTLLGEEITKIKNNSSSPNAIVQYNSDYDGNHMHLRFDTPAGGS